MRDERTKIGPVAAGFIVAGNMIGSGIFLLPASLGEIGSIVIVGWMVVLAGALLIGLVCSRLAILCPQEPGLAGYVRTGLGRRLGFIAAFFYWVSTWFGNVAIALAVTGYLASLVPVLKLPLTLGLATVAVIWGVTLANMAGVRFTARFEGVALVQGLAPVLLVAILGWWWFDPTVFTASWNVTGLSAGGAVAHSLASIIWAFLGLESAAVVAAVVRQPERNVPIATLGGIAVAGLVYITACTALTGVLSAAELRASTAPFADVATRLWGPVAGTVLAVCAMAKAAGTLAGWMLVGAETAEAGARLGLFPRLLSGVNRHGAPVRNLVFMAALMSVVCLATLSPTLGQQFDTVVNLAVVLNVIVYACACAALLRLTPGRRWDIAVAGGGLLFCVGLLITTGVEAMLVAAGLLAMGMALSLIRHATAGEPPPSRRAEGDPA
ncbi:amino acid permease [Nitrospirillum iridis]|uniref:Arginine/agmatine antiporter n=1 Tax=Nitrospirillum iridis TaxID=765888 RepID=A0A7X0EDU8_9PROT|nr:amino acid permease [Nitrospirillum iridis]MBB6250784.1 arginine:agmatine antiporter [Nitrospirillum iridis]